MDKPNRNESLRNAAKEAGVPIWRVAETMGVGEMTLTRLLRKKTISEKERAAFLAAVLKAAEEISREEEGE